MKKVVLLASGGLDSSTLFSWLLYEGVRPIPLFVNYGQHSADREREALLSILPDSFKNEVREVNVSSLYRDCNSSMLTERDLWTETVTDYDLYVPYRNQILLSIGASFAEIMGLSDVFSAFIESNVALGADCTTEFLNDMAVICKKYGSVNLEFPFMNFSKLEVAKIGIDLGVPLWQTYSCLARADVACGACPNCIDRNAALENLKMSK